MRTAQKLNQLIQLAQARGLAVRHECLDGIRGGVCWYGGKYWLFVDLALSVSEQVEQVAQALSDFEIEPQTKSPIREKRAA